MIMIIMMRMMLMLRYCEGIAMEETHKAYNASSLGGRHGTEYSEQSGDIWIRKESTPMITIILIIRHCEGVAM